MPLIEFQCKKCVKVYEELVKYEENGVYSEVICPFCGSSKKDRLVSQCAFNFTDPIGTDRWNSDSSGHDYRYKTKLPQAIQERENVQKKFDPVPYRDVDTGDIESGNYFGKPV